MSDARKIIEFLFVGTDNLSSGLGTMSDKLGSLADGLEAGTQPLANFTTGLLEAEAAVAVAGLALAAFAVNEAGQFDAAMRELTTLVGGGEEELQAFSSTVQTMGQTSIVSLEDLSGAMYKVVDDGKPLVNVTFCLHVACAAAFVAQHPPSRGARWVTFPLAAFLATLLKNTTAREGAEEQITVGH
jgi:hypothetical protein